MNEYNIETEEPIPDDRNYKKFVITGLVLLGLIILIAGILYKGSHTEVQVNQDSTDQEVSTADPVDIVLDFYTPWLDAVKSTSTDPYKSGLAAEKILSKELRTRLMSTEGHTETEIDPVLCQTTTPERVTGRIVSKQENEARVLIMAKEKELTGQSVFNLKRHNDGWFIDSISCSPGEFELPREFSFEKEGYLLKSVPPPFDSKLWHIVFEDDGTLGHVAPLFFSAESVCLTTEKSETPCTPDQFTEAVKIHLYGQMIESGVEVKRLEFLE
jgi:hypothetical protein